MLLSLLACTPEVTDVPVDSVAAVEDTSPVWERPDPAWTATQVGEQLALGLADGVPNPHPIQKLYAELMALGDETCPGDPEQLSNARQGIGGCTAESGAYYEGISSYAAGAEDVGAVLGGERYTEASWLLSGDFLLMDPDSNRFEFGGQARYVVSTSADETRWSAELAGTFRYEPSDSWIADIASNRVYISGVIPNQGAPETTIRGGMSNGAVDVYFEELVFGTGGCAGPPASGVISLRGEEGGWYRLELRDDCSGCGDVVFDERVELGESCPDLESFRARTESLRPLGEE